MEKVFTKPKRLLVARTQHLLVLLAAILGIQFAAKGQTTNASPYCAPSFWSFNSTCDGWAAAYEQIQFGQLNFQGNPCPNASRPDAYNYWQKTSFPKYTTSVAQGGSYELFVRTSPAINNPNNFGVYIDWNGDFDFNDADELVVSSVSIPLSSTWDFTRDISVPCSAKLGQTRMRLWTTPGFTVNGGQACNTTDWGEVFDFDITIAPSTNPTANFFLPDTVFTNSPATFINGNKTGYTKHEWSTSVGGLGNIISTNTNLAFAFPAAGSYQVRLTSTNCIGSATITKNVVVVDPTTAPTVKFVASRNLIELPVNALFVNEIVDFYDFSSSGPTSYFWEFTPKNPLATGFPIFGSTFDREVEMLFVDDTSSFEVCMTASNAVGSTKLCKADYVVIHYEQTGGTNKYENIICEDAFSSLDSGIVYDPGGKDGPYSNAPGGTVTCSFVIDICDAKELQLFIPVAGYQVFWGDYLRIYDGPNNGGKLLFQNGNNTVLAGNQSIVAPSGKATIEFQRDQWDPGTGFEVRWKAILNNDGPIKAGIGIMDKLRNDSIFSCIGGRTVRFQNNTANTRKVTDRQWIFDYDPNIAYPGGWKDSDLENPSYTYTTDGEYIVRLVVNSCEGWDTAYRTFYLGTSSAAPKADFKADREILKVGENTFLRNQTIGWCSGSWDINPSTYTLMNGSNLNDQDIQVQFDKKGRYTITYSADNDNGSDVRTITDYIHVIDYCTPDVSLPLQSVSISRVKLGSIDNNSGVGKDGYENNTSISTDLYAGAPYQLEVDRTDVFDPADRRVWIDFNRDGEFTASEIIAEDLGSNTKTFSTTIQMPNFKDLIEGEARMRVGITLSGSKLDACGPITVGEFEDYTVMLKRDDKPPVITMIGSDSVYIELGTQYIDDKATAFDNLEGDITGKIVTDNQVDSSQTGVYVVTYNVKDGSGVPAQQRIRYVFVVADMTKPVITVLGNAVETHDVNTTYSDAGATALDNPGAADLSGRIVTDNQVDETQLGSYVVEYSVTDNYGNSTSEQRVVNVVDRQAPVINCPPANYAIQVGTPFNNPTTVSDNYWQNVQLDVVTGSVNTSVFGTYKVTYTAVDGSGNVAANTTCTYTVTDLIPPVLTSRSGSEFMIAQVNDFSFTEPAVTGTDNYFPAVAITRTGSYDITQLGDYTITYTGTDGAGNTTIYTRVIRVVDTEKPVVIAPPVNIQRWMVFDAMAGVSVTDNYWAPSTFISGPGSVAVVSSNVNMLQEGIYEVTYQAIDGSGNISGLKFRTVNVVANTTGINDIAFANAINIYPNPNTGKFDVELGVPVNNTMKVTVTNMTGQVMGTFGYSDLVDGKLSVDLSTAAAGVYFVQVQSDNNIATKKVTVTR